MTELETEETYTCPESNWDLEYKSVFEFKTEKCYKGLH